MRVMISGRRKQRKGGKTRHNQSQNEINRQCFAFGNQLRDKSADCCENRAVNNYKNGKGGGSFTVRILSADFKQQTRADREN